MNEVPTLLQENEGILDSLFERQKELYKLTHKMISLARQAKQNAIQADNSFKWFSAIKNNNTVLLSKAV